MFWILVFLVVLLGVAFGVAFRELIVGITLWILFWSAFVLISSVIFVPIYAMPFVAYQHDYFDFEVFAWTTGTAVVGGLIGRYAAEAAGNNDLLPDSFANFLKVAALLPIFATPVVGAIGYSANNSTDTSNARGFDASKYTCADHRAALGKAKEAENWEAAREIRERLADCTD